MVSLKEGQEDLRRAGFKGESVQLAAHAPLQGFIDQLVLAYAGHAAKRFGDDHSLVVIAITGQINDLHLSARHAFSDQMGDVVGGHGHGVALRHGVKLDP